MHSVLEMAEDVLRKLDIVFKKLEAMETTLDNFGSYVKNVDDKVNALITKVETLEATTRNAMKSIEELDRNWRKTAPLSDKRIYLASANVGNDGVCRCLFTL